MQKLNELRMTLIILLIGLFFISGCFFNSNHTVTFKTNGGTEVKNVTIKSGSKLSGVETPIKDGYVFEGWYLDGQEFDMDTKIEEDITLVAKWTKKTYENADESEDKEEVEETNTKTTTTTITTTKSSTSTKNVTKSSTKAKTTTTTTIIHTTTTTKAILEEDSKTPTVPEGSTPSLDDEEEKKEPEEFESALKDVKIRIDIVGIDPLPEVIEEVQSVELEEDEEEQELDDEFNQNDESEENDDIDEEDNTASQSTKYIKISKLENISDSNVKSSIDEELIKSLVSNFNEWENITSNHGNTYDVTDGYRISKTENTIELIGDDNVTSFTVLYDGTGYAFYYMEENQTWYISYATASIEIVIDGSGIEGVIGITYYNNLETAILVANERVLDIEKQIITIYDDQVITKTLNVNRAITIRGNNNSERKYVISNEEGYLFDLKNIELDENQEIILENINFEVDKFINLGDTDITKIKLSDVNIKIADKENEEELKDLFDNEDVTIYSTF